MQVFKNDLWKYIIKRKFLIESEFTHFNLFMPVNLNLLYKLKKNISFHNN